MESIPSTQPIVTALALFGLGPEPDSRAKRILELEAEIKAKKAEVLALRHEEIRCALNDYWNKSIQCIRVRSLGYPRDCEINSPNSKRWECRLGLDFIYSQPDGRSINVNIVIRYMDWDCFDGIKSKRFEAAISTDDIWKNYFEDMFTGQFGRLHTSSDEGLESLRRWMMNRFEEGEAFYACLMVLRSHWRTLILD